MDLNIDNYSVDELLNVFNINGKNSDIKELEKCLSKSIFFCIKMLLMSLTVSSNNSFFVNTLFLILECLFSYNKS